MRERGWKVEKEKGESGRERERKSHTKVWVFRVFRSSSLG